jgi:hypothetical protein
MSGKNWPGWLFVLPLLLLSACSGKGEVCQVATYPPTDKVASVFQRAQVPEQCRVFAQLMATLPAQQTGAQFVENLTAEAKAKGADMMLIGQSRQCTSGADLAFTYFGPDHEYKISDWPGWSFGYEEWQGQGFWANIGYKEWGDASVRFDYPVLIQVAFLRCQP